VTATEGPEGACRRPAGRKDFEEKIALAVHDFDAVAHLGIPLLRYTDGPNGIRGPDNMTAFPASLTWPQPSTSDWPPPSAPRSPRRRATCIRTSSRRLGRAGGGCLPRCVVERL
jgi:hypothetical protein